MLCKLWMLTWRHQGKSATLRDTIDTDYRAVLPDANFNWRTPAVFYMIQLL
jgi:hypothetical protein